MGWRLKHSKAESARRFLFPAIVTAGLLGCGLLLPFAMETFIAYYSGSSKPLALSPRGRLTTEWRRSPLRGFGCNRTLKRMFDFWDPHEVQLEVAFTGGV
jgi:hypothetical protein